MSGLSYERLRAWGRALAKMVNSQTMTEEQLADELNPYHLFVESVDGDLLLTGLSAIDATIEYDNGNARSRTYQSLLSLDESPNNVIQAFEQVVAVVFQAYRAAGGPEAAIRFGLTRADDPTNPLELDTAKVAALPVGPLSVDDDSFSFYSEYNKVKAVKADTADTLLELMGLYYGIHSHFPRFGTPNKVSNRNPRGPAIPPTDRSSFMSVSTRLSLLALYIPTKSPTWCSKPICGANFSLESYTPEQLKVLSKGWLEGQFVNAPLNYKYITDGKTKLEASFLNLE